MGKYQLSKAAQFDIDDLYAGGVLKYGLCQADKYYDGLIERFEFLTENSNIGLNSDELAPNLQRFSIHEPAISRYSDQSTQRSRS
jgi:toxin ParE1/3/4